MSVSSPSTPISATSTDFRAQESIKPNPHPYAIRTTSTGVLSRSNSSGRNLAASRHHYVPLPPSPTKRENKHHRPTKSLTSAPSFPSLESPKPLPVPPEFTGNAKRRVRTRAETLPAMILAPEASIAPAELPANPKLWTISQLSTYLLSALRATSRISDSNESLSAALVQDVIAIVREAKYNGRLFLRLNEDDLESMGISQSWREALLAASRTLRQSAIKGKIWGVDSDAAPTGTVSPTLPSHPFSSALYNSSSSSLDLSGKEDEPTKSGRKHHGRVRGMVESFERRGSFSSESSFDDSFPEDRQSLGRFLREGSGVIEEQVIRSPSPQKTVPLMCTDAVCLLEPSMEDLLADEADETADADRTLWGARAWEELDLAPGVTVKRVPDYTATVRPQPSEAQDDDDVQGQDTNEPILAGGSFGRSVREKRRDERRVVTAIFTPSTPPHNLPEVVQDAVTKREASSTWDRPQASETVREGHAVATPRELALEAELADTRRVIEAFQARLEYVERELLRLQELEAQRGSLHGALCPAGTVEALAATDVDVLLNSAEEPPLLLSASSRAPPSQSDEYDFTLESELSTSLPAVPQPLAADAPGTASRGPRQDKRPRDAAEDEHNHPSALSDLPQYVFLVGFGVCAVVLQVVIRKFAGRGSGLGWR